MSRRFSEEFKTIDEYVAGKLEKFSGQEKSFRTLFDMMFSEKDNVLFEKSEGYRITETTYGECRDSIERRAFQLNRLLGDIPKGSLIGIYMQNSREYIEIFWSILLCGCRPLLMNLRLDHAVLENTIETYDVKAVVVDQPTDFSVPMISAEDTAPQEERLLPEEFGDEIMFMSSGTSSHVKVCVYTAEEFYHILRNSYNIIQESAEMKLHYKDKIKQLMFLPLYHIFGFVTVYLWFAFFSRTIVLLADLMPQTIQNTIRRHEVTHIFAVPLLWNRIYDQALNTIRGRGEETWNKFQKGMKISRKLAKFPRLHKVFAKAAFKEIRENIFGDSISFMISGGSEIRPAVLEFMNAIGYHLANGYGMTEIGITSVELGTDLRVLSSGSVGRPFDSLEYKIDEAGQLLVRGRSMAHSIMENGQRRERAEEWFPTGDLAEYRDGRYYILCRQDDVVIAPSGENLNPNLIERKLGGKGIRGVCLTALRENDLIQPVLLVSVQPFMAKEVLSEVRKGLIAQLREMGLDTQVGRIIFIKEPLMEADDIKLNRARIAQKLSEGKFTAVKPEDAGKGDRSELKEHIRTLFAQTLELSPEEISDGDDFFLDKGGNSLDYFSIVMQLQNTYEVGFPADAERSLSTVEDIAEFILKMVTNRD